MKTKKWLLLALCLLFALVFVPAAARAEEYSGKCGFHLYWSFDKSTGKLTIYDNIDPDYNFPVEPSTMYDFSSGESPWYSLRTQITSVSFIFHDDSFISIGDNAFLDCTGLTSITIPQRVLSIGDCAFMNCTGLTSVTIPSIEGDLGDYAFYGCTGLTSVTIPQFHDLGDYVFSGCTGLTSATISYGANSIADGMFSGCSGLTSVTIPNTVTRIGNNAFHSTGLTSVTIPNSVTSIGNSAFYGSTELTSITIPNSVTSIGGEAFYCCTGLTSITIPNSVTSIGAGAFELCTRLTSVTIPNSVTCINGYTFADTGLTSVTIPSSVTDIGNDAFSGCTGLTSVTIPNSVTSIGSHAFDGCSSLENVYYLGTKMQRNSLSIKSENYDLVNATWHYQVVVALNPNGGVCNTPSIFVEYGKPYGTMPMPEERTGYTFAGWWTTRETGGKEVTYDTVCYASGNFTLYARWTEEQTCTVTLDPNGGSVSADQWIVTHNHAYGEMPTPTRNGYTFLGWWTAKEEGGERIEADTVCVATQNFTLYARWAKSYTVTLNPNGGSVSPTTKTVTYGHAYGALPTPTRSGYSFTGWWTTKEEGGKQVTADTICYASGNYTLFARWAKSYTVTLNPNGGSASPTTKTVIYGQAYGTLPTPTRRGYVFAGWWTAKDSGGKQVTAATVCYATGNYTLYARWIKGVTVSFNANGGTCGTAAKTVIYGQAYGTLPTPTRRGYVFTGWWTAKEGDGKQVTAATVCYATGNYTLYARWIQGATVSFNANGGTCGSFTKTVTYGQAYGTMPVPTRKGYTFVGWWTVKDAGGKKVTASTICYATSDYTLYARWTEGYTMTFNANGGTCTTKTKVVKYAQQYGTLPTPTRVGYNFAGWWTTKAEGGKKVSSTTVCYASAGYTLYARWTVKKYVVTLNPNGGECATKTKTVTYGQAYGTMPVPTRKGYTFDGWWTTTDTVDKQLMKVTATTVCYAAANHTLYAWWTPKTYTVTFNPNGGTCTTKTKTVTYGESYGELPEPTRAGYQFAGWRTTQNTGGKWIYSSTICYATGNYTLYATWYELPE